MYTVMYKQGAQYWTGSKESNQKFFEELLLEASVCIANYIISITYILTASYNCNGN